MLYKDIGWGWWEIVGWWGWWEIT